MERFEGMPAAPSDINITKGSVHIVAVRGFVEYVIHNQTAADFLDWVKTTEVPDETFFSSLNHSPRLHVPGSYLGMLILVYSWSILWRYKMLSCPRETMRCFMLLDILLSHSRSFKMTPLNRA